MHKEEVRRAFTYVYRSLFETPKAEGAGPTSAKWLG